jgi:hypothetical protein
MHALEQVNKGSKIMAGINVDEDCETRQLHLKVVASGYLPSFIFRTVSEIVRRPALVGAEGEESKCWGDTSSSTVFV